MDDREVLPGEHTAATWQVEVVVAGTLALVGAAVIVDSVRVGIGWGAEGPQAGFFPFYVGLILLLASSATVILNLLPGRRDRANFVDRTKIARMLAVLIPLVIYVIAVRWLGLYVASALLVGLFMRVHGRFGVAACLGVAVGLMVGLFALFELWFLVPLPKGPLETALGF